MTRVPAMLLPLLLLLGVAIAQAQTGGAATAPPAAASSAKPDGDYVGSDTCLTCHDDQQKLFRQTRMGKVFFNAPRTALEKQGCEACHGPGRAHVEGGGDKAAIFRFGKDSPASAAEQNAQCLQCHSKGVQLFWRGSPHESRGLTCVTCHQVMKSNTAPEGLAFQEPLSENKQFTKPTQMEVCFQCHQMRRAQVQRSSHMPFREGKVTCSSCHNPHGSPNPKQLLQSTVNENCYSCHAERRGPFLWEHPPVMENCANCHEPHGSTNPQMLKVRAPRLCQQCHITARHPTQPQNINVKVFNRGCLNCHSMIHGSNHPSGMAFNR